MNEEIKTTDSGGKVSANDSDPTNTVEAESLIQVLRDQDLKNAETVKMLRRLNDNFMKNRIVLEAKIKNIVQERNEIKDDNAKLAKTIQKGVDVVNNIQIAAGCNDAKLQQSKYDKLFTGKGKLRKDGSLLEALNDLLHDLENAVNEDELSVNRTTDEVDQMQNKILEQERDQAEKLEEANELTACLYNWKNRLQDFENSIKAWLKEYYNLVKDGRYNIEDSIRKNFETAANQIVEIQNDCDAGDEEFLRLTAELEKKQKQKRESDGRFEESDKIMNKLEAMPLEHSDRLRNIFSRRKNVAPMPQHFDFDVSTQLISLYQWADQQRKEFEGLLGAMENCVAESEKQCKLKEDECNKEEQAVDDNLLALENEEANLVQKTDKLQHDIDNYRIKEIKIAKQKTNALKSMLNTTSVLLHQRQTESLKMQKKIEDDLDDEEEANDQIEKLMENSRKKVFALEAELERTEQEIEGAKIEAESRKEQLEEQRKDNQKILEDLKAKKLDVIEQIEKTKEVLKGQEELKSQINKKKERCKTMEIMLEQKENEYKNGQEQLRKLQSNCDLATERRQHLLKAIKELEHKNKIKENRIAREEETLNELKNDVEREESGSTLTQFPSTESLANKPLPEKRWIVPEEGVRTTGASSVPVVRRRAKSAPPEMKFQDSDVPYRIEEKYPTKPSEVPPAAERVMPEKKDLEAIYGLGESENFLMVEKKPRHRTRVQKHPGSRLLLVQLVEDRKKIPAVPKFAKQPSSSQKTPRIKEPKRGSKSSSFQKRSANDSSFIEQLVVFRSPSSKSKKKEMKELS